MAVKKYDIRRGADIYRAIDSFRLQRWILTGKIRRGEVIVWRSGLSGWRRPEELDELWPYFDKWDKLQLEEEEEVLKAEVLPRKKEIKDVLIIDDEEDLCYLLNEVLSQRGYDVSIANTKREALECIKEKNHDLVFLDLKLPDGDGMEVLSQIKKINIETTVNIISAYGSKERKEEAKRLGVYAFIDKPFTEEDILKAIEELSKLEVY